MGRIFNWFSWQLERRVMKQQIDRLLGDINQVAQEAAELRTNLAETEMLLHDAERGAKLAAEEQDNLKTQLGLHKSAAAYWENVARNQQRWIAELRRPASELGSVIETTEPAESELERRAWEVFMHYQDYNLAQAFELAHGFMEERDRRRKEQENQNNGPF